ncbi:MAG: helix-turn-helix domain-containing protein [Victivallales bacterium]|nr:helix-turn-helix domain-containing protein [Victivallales bacterium]
MKHDSSISSNMRIRPTTAKIVVKAMLLFYEADVVSWEEVQAIRYVLTELAKKGEMPKEPEKRLLDLHQVADILAIGESTLKRGLAEGRIPLPKVRIGGAVRFRWEDVVKLIDAIEPMNKDITLEP